MTHIKITHPERKFIYQNGIAQKAFAIGDFDKLLQVLINIVQNSIKFSPSDSPVKISLSKKTPCFLIKVQDQGVGIAKKDLPKIFEAFYKKSNDQKQGMGLGLYLAKEIIERHRGEIKITSNLGKGTTMEIKIPEAKFHV